MEVDATICPVCCSEYSESRKAFTNPCSHSVCEPCLRRLCHDGFPCVVCRAPLDLDRAVRTVALETLNRTRETHEQSPAASCWSDFSAGCSVQLVGLAARPELNGRHGSVIQYLPDRERYRVDLGQSEVVAVKKSSLQPYNAARKSSEQIKEGAKERGNRCFQNRDFERAVVEFSAALMHDSGDHRLYSNRSAAYAQLRDYNAALVDAQHSVTLCPSYSKGWGRIAAANHGLGNFPGAIKGYRKALELDPGNSLLKNGLADAEARLHQRSGASNNSRTAPAPAPASRSSTQTRRPQPPSRQQGQTSGEPTFATHMSGFFDTVDEFFTQQPEQKRQRSNTGHQNKNSGPDDCVVA